MRRAMAALFVGAAAIGSAMLAHGARAQLAPAPSISVFMRPGAGANGGMAWAPAAFVCDAINRDRVLVLSVPARDRRVQLWTLDKPGLAASRSDAVLGRGEPGMNQIYYPLSTAAGQQAGWVHALNPGIVEPGATTPAVTSVKWGQQTTNCRFAPQSRVLGATARRSV